MRQQRGARSDGDTVQIRQNKHRPRARVDHALEAKTLAFGRSPFRVCEALHSRPRTYGVHRFDSLIGIFCALRQESVGKILRFPEAFTM